jgi:hypothetical protein
VWIDRDCSIIFRPAPDGFSVEAIIRTKDDGEVRGIGKNCAQALAAAEAAEERSRCGWRIEVP